MSYFAFVLYRENNFSNNYSIFTPIYDLPKVYSLPPPYVNYTGTSRPQQHQRV